MKKKPCHTRRKFIEGSLFTGIVLAAAKLTYAGQYGDRESDSVLPLLTESISRPEGVNCFWVGFSPVNDQAAFVSGTYDNMVLYVSKSGQTDSLDILWRSDKDVNCIKSCAWSPNGQEMAFLVQTVNNLSHPKSAKILIYVVNVASQAIRELIVIGENIDGIDRQLVNVSYKKGMSWWDNSFVCVPSNDGGVLKFDTHTGQSGIFIPPQSGVFISSIALTQSGELRFVKAKKLEAGKAPEFFIGGLKQDGTICDYGNLNQQLGQIFIARLSQDGNIVFAEKGDIRYPESYVNIIYNIDTRSVIGQIPRDVRKQKDVYTYIPLTVRNSKELILIEGASLKVDGVESMRSPIMKAVKLNLL